jgi:hypothetical protein
MSERFSRRSALRIAAAACTPGLAALTSCADGAESESPVESAPSTQLTSYLNGGQILFRWNNFVVAAYRANPVQKYPYFSDLAGPLSGIPLTTESSEPHPHHRGIWIGCEPLCGGDYWKDGPLDKGQIRSLDLSLVKSTPNSAVVHNRCQWLRRRSPSPLVEDRRIQFTVLSDRIRLIDFDTEITALCDISIAKAKHSFFAVRVAPDIAPIGGGTLINSENGIGETGTFGKHARWCGYFGRRALRTDVIEGVAVMDHPDNPWAPCPWFTRDYGHLSPSPFNFIDSTWTLAQGAVIRLKYRVVLHAGDPSAAGLNRIYKDWVAV